MLREYTKCFELAHMHGIAGAWLFVICDLNRPIDDSSPLIIDVLPNVLESHPEIPPFIEIPAMGNLAYIAQLRDLFKDAAAYLRATYPEAFTRPQPDGRAFLDQRRWGQEQSRDILQQFLHSKSPTPLVERIEARSPAAAGAAALATVVAVFSAYTAAEYFFDKVYAEAEKKIAAEKAQQEAERKAAEQAEQEAKNAFKDTFGREPRAIERSSDHVDRFDRNRDTISRTA